MLMGGGWCCGFGFGFACAVDVDRMGFHNRVNHGKGSDRKRLGVLDLHA